VAGVTGAGPPQVAVVRDLERSITVVTITGRVTLSSARRVRADLLRCLDEYPLALVVDVSRLAAARRAVLGLFPAAVRRGRHGPSVTLALCAAPSSHTGRVVRRLLGRVIPVYPDRDRAVVAVLGGRSRLKRVSARLDADPRSAGLARRVVCDACVAWGLADLADAAMLVASELVSNAVRYAGTAFELTATLRGAYLHIALRDGSREPPRMPAFSASGPPSLGTTGRGLHLISASASGWGTTVADTGKVVWAALRVRPAI
jgi:hypothetical protein